MYTQVLMGVLVSTWRNSLTVSILGYSQVLDPWLRVTCRGILVQIQVWLLWPQVLGWQVRVYPQV